MIFSTFLLFIVAAVASASAPIPGFRPPAVPLFVQSPLVSVWSNSDNLYDSEPIMWNGVNMDLFAAVRVDGSSYLLMGSPSQNWNDIRLQTPVQLGPPFVYNTQTIYQFQVGSDVFLNLTFTSPLLTNDYDVLSSPTHYLTFSATSSSAHSIQVYFDTTATSVAEDSSTSIMWRRDSVSGVDISDSVTSMTIQPTVQNPLSSTSDNLSWGLVHLVTDLSLSNSSSSINFANLTRSAFWTNAALPGDLDNANGASLPLYSPSNPNSISPDTGAIFGVDFPGNDMNGFPVNLSSNDPNLCWALCNTTSGCVAWAYGQPGCDQYSAPTCWLKGSTGGPSSNICRISGVQASRNGPGVPVVAAAVLDISIGSSNGYSAAGKIMWAVDEILSVSWFGEACPPYWRRTTPINSTEVQLDMLSNGWSSYTTLKAECDAFDVQMAAKLSNVGGDYYSTVSQLTYRQVFGAIAYYWVPSTESLAVALKEISSDGDFDTSDVVFPAFPQLLYYSPELLQLITIPLLQYAMNYTNEPYPLPWAPHHLGHWPLANLPYTQQENMPLEESSYFLLSIAAIGQAMDGDLSWLAPYWPVVQTWYDYITTLMPFPGLQLSTDDFNGQLYNATNLALKGIAATYSFGYITATFTGNMTAAQEAFSLAAQYAEVMVDYSWEENASPAVINGVPDSHFMIGFRGSQGDGGDPGSWPMLYNGVFLSIFGLDNLLPNQTYYLQQMRDWYGAFQFQQYGVPLNSRQNYTKDDWEHFLAAMYFEAGANGTLQPSQLSAQLLQTVFNYANETNSRVPLSDWTWTQRPYDAGFMARPVYGAVYAPMLVAEAEPLGLGKKDEIWQLAHDTFEAKHAEYYERKDRH